MSDAAATVRTPWRTFRLIVFGVCGTLLVLAAALVAQRLAIMRSVIDYQLRALGLEEVSHEVERFDLHEFGVRNLRIGGDGGFSADEISVRYSPRSLLAGRLSELSVRGVRLRGRVDETGVSFDALDPLRRRDGGAAPGAAPWAALPARRVDLDDWVVEVETPQGPLVTRLAAELTEGAGGDVSARASVEAEHAPFTGAARLDARGTPDAFEGNASFDLTGGGEIAPGIELEPTALAAEAHFAYSKEKLAVEVAFVPTPFALAIRRPGGSVRAVGEVPALSLAMPPTRAGDAPAIHLEAAGGGRVRFPDLGIEARDLGIDLVVDRPAGLPTGSLRIGSLIDTQATRRLCELALAGTLGADGARQTFDLTATGSTRKLVIDVRGSHDPQTGEGSARVDVRPLEFRPGGLQPAALSPLLANAILEASGGVDLRGALRWNSEAELRGGFDVALRDLSVSSELGGFERLNAAIRIEGPWPPSTPPRQLVSMARMDFGIELTNGLISFQLRRNGVLAIHSAEWSLAGGKLRTQAELDPSADSQELVLEVVDLDLAELLKLADLSGLSGKGTLRGRIPVRRRGPTLEIIGGVVSATSPGGWLRYRPDAGVAGVADQEQGFDVALAVLRNFHYERLEATLDGDAAGPVNVAIHLAGANPDYLGGHPVEFNLGIESRLVDLLQNATAVYQIPAEIEKRLEEMSKKSR
jgi:hypothetical protein